VTHGASYFTGKITSVVCGCKSLNFHHPYTVNAPMDVDDLRRALLDMPGLRSRTTARAFKVVGVYEFG
jgi:hypothetical protein